jgi:uncharacterized protein GlcG (DUF336 family)
MKRSVSFIAGTALILASCGGGGGTSTAGPTPGPPAPGAARLFADPAQLALSVAEVQQIIAQAVAEAQARSLPGTIVVVDRVGNVLAAYRMTGANDNLSVPPSPSGINHDLQGINVTGGAVAGAIAKAITGAYLSSSGNAFSTRTASQIVQQHFPPSAAAAGLESGPLFGVQFSQLPCSDLSARFGVVGPAAMIGPKRSPLGLSADAGGFPLYKNGVVVGGVGVMADGVYSFDPEIQDVDHDGEEAIALAASQGFAAPAEIQADRVTVDGTTLRFSDATLADLRTNPAAAPAFGTLGGAGAVIPVNGYFAGAILPGTPYGSEASGIRLATAAEFADPDAYVLTNGSGANRYPILPGTEPTGAALTAAEVRAILEEAFKIMAAARAQIRRPLDSRAQVTISVVDLGGRPLGIVRGPDAPIFGTDVSLQKARTAVFFSSATAAAQLSGDPDPDVAGYVPKAQAFFNNPAALTGQNAFTDRANGNVSRPYFPDGELGRPPGAFSRPIAEFNPFSTGLQSALITPNILQHVGFVLTGVPPDTLAQCTHLPTAARLANGIQIFPGSVPIYRGNTLIGGIGVSGDGIDQDDMISFLGLHNGGLRLGGVGNAPLAIRADQIVVPVSGSAGVRLRYVNCPFNPFLGTNQQNVCDGK